MIKNINVSSKVPFNIEKGAILENLGVVNYIYGANASGKTTISNFLQSLNENGYENRSIEWEGDKKERILVYNKKFKDKNLISQSMPGVFTLGEASNDEINNIKGKEEALRKKTENLNSLKKSLSKLAEDLKNHRDEFYTICWSTYQKYVNDFGEVFTGFKNSKEKFANKVLEIDNNDYLQSTTKENLLSRYDVIFKKERIKYELLDFSQLQFSDLNAIEIDNIWGQIIIGKNDVDIARIINEYNISDWVHEGKQHIHDNICPFCQQKTITNDFKNKLDLFFDISYTNSVSRIKSYHEQYTRITNFIVSTLNNIAINYERFLNDDYRILINQVSRIFSENSSRIKDKVNEPSSKVIIEQTHSAIEQITTCLSEVNNRVIENNRIVDDIKNEKSIICNDVWKFIANEIKTTVNSYSKKANGINKGIAGIQGKINTENKSISNLNAEIVELNKKITSIQPSVDEINTLLKAYGFNSFMIVPSQETNSYQIKRADGTIVHQTLSEGEETFISFLYFLQQIKGGKTPEGVAEKRVVVIDDPICSLDSNVLFIVSSLLKEVVKGIRNHSTNVVQLILFTHNVYFFKEMDNIYKDKNQPQTNPYYWIIRKGDLFSTIDSYQQNCPISNSYELLWRQIRDKENLSVITTQNVMRRIIETYFKMLGKYKDDTLLARIDNPQQKEICRSLIYWINDGSHCIPDDMYVEEPSDTINKYFNAFRLIFEKSNQIEHYNMMMNIK